MIEMPTRSITRFFIPMIDVLTLLFCIYLLMPMVSDNKGETAATREVKEKFAKEQESLESLKKDLDKQLADLQADRAKIAQEMKKRLSVRVLEINEKDGSLFYRGPKGTILPISKEADAHELIKRDLEASQGQKRELYYLILYPRGGDGAYPLGGQIQDYDRWFAEVTLGYDIPGEGGK